VGYSVQDARHSLMGPGPVPLLGGDAATGQLIGDRPIRVSLFPHGLHLTDHGLLRFDSHQAGFVVSRTPAAGNGADAFPLAALVSQSSS